MADEDTVTPSVSLPASLLGAVDQAAADRRWNRSFLIREALLQWLRLNDPKALRDSERPTVAS